MATATLVCKQCNFENEPERVYCHNCGAKLDRSLLPPEATRREDPVYVQERVRKMVSPRRGVIGLRHIRNLFFSLLIGAALAALLLIVKPPANLPELTKDAIMNAPSIGEDVSGLMAQATPHRMTYKEDQVNAYLQYYIRGKETVFLGIPLKFERAFVHFLPGSCSVTSEQSIFGLPLYATTVRSLEVRNGALASQVLGGSLGSLRVPAAAMPYLEGVFKPLVKALEKDYNLLVQLQSITFQDKTVSLINKPATGSR